MRFKLSKIKELIKEKFLDIFFPPLCFSCRKFLLFEERKNFLCHSCFSSIKIHSSLFCPVCRSRITDNKKICHFENNFLLGSATDFENPIIRNLIHSLKFKKLSALSNPLSLFLSIYLKKLSLRLDQYIIIPIPLSKQREIKRGFNQSKLIAQKISQEFNIPLFDILKKIKNSKPQAETKNSTERIENIKDCFILKNKEIIKNKNILLIDDVYTTGSTAREAIRILKIFKVNKIIVLTIAKT